MRMDLRTDLKSQLRDQNRNSKAAWLQSRWQEVSERERRARLHNQKLLQDFQRAQDTLTDLVARTEAMNTIRVEYERYLEQNFPRWQQKLKDKRLLEQRKRIEEHLKACIQQMEEDQRINGGKTSSIGSHSPSSSISSDPSHPPISHPIPLSRERKEKRGEVSPRKPKSTLSKQDNKQNLQGIIPNDSQPLYAPFKWPSEAEPQQSNISKQTKTFQNIHQALNSPIALPADPRYGPYPVIQQKQPSSGHFPQHLKPWAGGVQSAPSGAPWMGVPVNSLVWKMLRMSEAGAEELRYSEESGTEKWRKDSNSEVQKHQDQRRRRKDKGSNCSSELDTKSACLSDGHGDSIESGPLSTVRKQRRRERQRHRSSSGEKGVVSVGSSSRSDQHFDNNNEKNEISQSSTAARSRASNTQVKSTAGEGSSSECGNRPSEDANVKLSSVMEKMTKQRRRETEIHLSSSREMDGVSVGSSSRSVHHSDTNNEKNEISQSSTATTSRASNTQVKSTAGVRSTKQLHKEREQEDNCKEDRITDSPTAVEKKNKKKNKIKKTKKRIRKNEDESEEEKPLTDQEERVSEDGEQSREGKEEEEEDDVGDEEQDEEVKSEGLCNKRRSGGEKSEGASLVEMEEEEEDDEEEEDGGDKHEEDDDDDDDDGDEELMEKSGEEEDDDQEDGEDSNGDDGDEDEAEEMNVKVKAPRSDERGNDSEDAASDSKLNNVINDSLKDLYKDEETENEELYNQEIEDDIEDDEDDDDDDVVVEKVYPWSRGPAYNHTKYQDDEDEDDVEGLLAPKINIQEHHSDEEKKTLNSKDLQSDSEEDRSHRKPVSAPVKEKPKDEPADSDDEFDHFYD